MSNETKQVCKSRRNLCTFDLTAGAKAALKRIKRRHGITKVAAVERGIAMLEHSLTREVGCD